MTYERNGGSVFSQIVDKEIKVPVLVNKDYFIPSFVNENTLVIISSYSGNTEETVQAMEAALKQNAKICCVTSGGKIKEMAEANGCDEWMSEQGFFDSVNSEESQKIEIIK